MFKKILIYIEKYFYPFLVGMFIGGIMGVIVHTAVTRTLFAK
jgi:hypothetical protein